MASKPSYSRTCLPGTFYVTSTFSFNIGILNKSVCEKKTLPINGLKRCYGEKHILVLYTAIAPVLIEAF